VSPPARHLRRQVPPAADRTEVRAVLPFRTGEQPGVQGVALRSLAPLLKGNWIFRGLCRLGAWGGRRQNQGTHLVPQPSSPTDRPATRRAAQRTTMWRSCRIASTNLDLARPPRLCIGWRCSRSSCCWSRSNRRRPAFRIGSVAQRLDSPPTISDAAISEHHRPLLPQALPMRGWRESWRRSARRPKSSENLLHGHADPPVSQSRVDGTG